MIQFLTILLLTIGIAFILNRILGSILPIFIQGSVSFLSAYSISNLSEDTTVTNGWQVVLSGIVFALFSDRYSRMVGLDDRQIRVEIQGLGFYALITSIIIAILL
jgi:hypothetical protein